MPRLIFEFARVENRSWLSIPNIDPMTPSIALLGIKLKVRAVVVVYGLLKYPYDDQISNTTT
jgi:hypothetical protein